MEYSIAVPKILKIEVPCDPAILYLGIYGKKMKSLSQKDMWTPMFIKALLTIAKKCEQTKFSSKWMDKKDEYMHTIEYYSGIKRKNFCHLQQHGYILQILAK